MGYTMQLNFEKLEVYPNPAGEFFFFGWIN